MLSTLLKVAAVALFAVAAVKAQTPSTGVCGQWTWTELQNTHQLQGIATNDQTLDACKQSCVANSSCTGLDWDASVTPKCYLHGYWSGAKIAGTGVLHADITRTASSSCTDCTARWSDAIPDTNVAGGTSYQSAISFDDCKAACVSSSLCYGIDWDLVGAIPCWLTGNGPKRTGQAPGVRHYDLNYKPDPVLCSNGYILYTSYGVVSVTSSQLLTYTNNIDEAAVLIESPCQAKTIPGNSYNDTCLSYQYAAQPGFYMHTAYSNLDVASGDTAASRSFTIRFKEDASFIKGPLNNNNLFSISSAVFPNYYISDYVSLVRGPTSSSFSPTPNFYSGRSATNDVASITWSCPRVWSRIDKATVSNGISPTYLSTSCRQKAHVFRDNVVGVSENPCSIALATQDDLHAIPSETATYYDLLNPAPWQCKRGCVNAWTPIRSTSQVAYSDYGQYDFYACQQACSGSSCQGIAYEGGRCFLIPINPSGYPSKTFARWLALRPVFTDCGSCISTLHLAYDSSDPAAVQTVAVTQTDECLTVCLNRKTCFGCEIRSGICYISIYRNTSLVDTAPGTAVYTSVTRNPCGNGCVHKWDFLVNTKYDSGIQNMPSVTTERQCRLECIKQANCTGCDWKIDTRICSLGINNPQITNYGTANQYNHFELQRGANCDN